MMFRMRTTTSVVHPLADVRIIDLSNEGLLSRACVECIKSLRDLPAIYKRHFFYRIPTKENGVLVQVFRNSLQSAATAE